MKAKSCLLSVAIVSVLATAALPVAAANRTANRAGDAPVDAGVAAIARAKALLAGPAAQRVHRAGGDGFVAEAANVLIDADGTEHVRFQRTFQGDLPVIGGDFVLHSRNGVLEGVSQTLPSAARPGIVPRVSRHDAIIEAVADFGIALGDLPQAQLVVYALGATPVLAHEVVLKGVRADQTPSEMHYFVDAESGKLLDKWDGIQTARPGRDADGCSAPVAAVGTGHSLTEGTVALDTVKCGDSYQLKDLTRGGGYTTNMGLRQSGMGAIYTDADNEWGNGGLDSSATVAADAHYGVSATWDYYQDVHGRNGIANNGAGAISRVHYGRNYGNAFWNDSCFCMTFGDGDNGVSVLPLVALDIAGHEMSHGVTGRSARLVYRGESGGLNEATSDIFGTMVEWQVDNASDPGDYMIGEKLYVGNDGTMALRYMFKPSLDGLSPDCYSPSLGQMDVHYSSGVANHFYYLLAEGAVVPDGFGEGGVGLAKGDMVCNGNTTLAGIGRHRRAGGGQPLDRQPDLSAATDRVRRLVPPRPDRGPYRLPVPGRVVLQDAPQGQGRAGAGGLGDRCRRQAGIPGSGARGGRVDRCLARAAGRPERPRARHPAASHLRRRQGAVRGDRVLVPDQPAPALCGPRLPQPHRQGPHPRPGPGEAGLLGGLRPGPGRGRGRRRRGPPAGSPLHRQVEAVVPLGGRLCGRQPRRAPHDGPGDCQRDGEPRHGAEHLDRHPQRLQHDAHLLVTRRHSACEGPLCGVD